MKRLGGEAAPQTPAKALRGTRLLVPRSAFAGLVRHAPAGPGQSPGLVSVLSALPQARIVGGAVRDWLAGMPVSDIDLATPDPPDAVIAALERAGLRVVPTGLAHGTVTAIHEGQGFEITTLRRDERTDGRHAEVAWTDDWQEDAARRDFTINAMSIDQAGTLFDYFGGAEDLAAGRVRFVGAPARRIAEDVLRNLRYFRFLARYGRGEPDAEAVAAIAAAVPALAQLSAERVWSESKRILAAPDPREAVALMQSTGVLDAILPEGADPASLATLVAAGAPPDPMLRLAALLRGDPTAFAARLKLSTAEAAQLAALRTSPSPGTDADDAALRRLLADHPPALLIDRVWLTAGPQALRDRIAALDPPVFPLEGRDALALGAAPGPAIGEALRAVRAWWLAGGCVADRAACRAELARLLGLPGSVSV